jgi:hypothetical protein
MAMEIIVFHVQKVLHAHTHIYIDVIHHLG